MQKFLKKYKTNMVLFIIIKKHLLKIKQFMKQIKQHLLFQTKSQKTCNKRE